MPSTSASPILQVKGLRKAYGSHRVLHDIDLSVQRGELVFIIGPSGSGKSTLLRCCNRLEDFQAGKVILDDVDIGHSRTDLNAVRQKIGMVFQSFNLYPHMTALQNVTLALRKVQGLPSAQAQERAEEALNQVGLLHKAGAHPAQLSGGQQQRIAIARALALRPQVVLFDEPTSALDPELVESVLSVMRDMRERGITMVVVSHEMRFARDAADRVVFMADGRILEQGPPDRLFQAPQHPRAQEFLRAVNVA